MIPAYYRLHPTNRRFATVELLLSQAAEDYLKTIYKLRGEGVASTSEIARELDVSKASVTNMLKRLKQLKLVEYQSYKGVSLTEAGRQIALEIIRHHRLLETYLREVMGYPWDKMHEEAERLEHHISEDFEDRLEAMLGYPTHDPHGDPIPSRTGELPDVSSQTLADSREGDVVTVERVPDKDPLILKKLEVMGILPGEMVRVVRTATHLGSGIFSVGGRDVSLETQTTREIYVKPE